MPYLGLITLGRQLHLLVAGVSPAMTIPLLVNHACLGIGAPGFACAVSFHVSYCSASRLSKGLPAPHGLEVLVRSKSDIVPYLGLITLGRQLHPIS